MDAHILFIFAAIAFGIAAIKDGWLGIAWTPAGFCFVAIALWLV